RVYWTQVGTHVAIGNDLEALKQVLDRASGGSPSAMKAIAAKLPEGETIVVYVDQRRQYQNMMPMFERDAGRSPDSKRIMDGLKSIQGSFDGAVTKIYVSKDYSSVTSR